MKDERFGQLIKRHGVVCEYVSDYEIGRILLASVALDGTVTWAVKPLA